MPIGPYKKGLPTMSRKKKFDLTGLVHQGYLKDGQKLVFVSDPAKACTVMKQPNGEFKVYVGPQGKGEVMTVHAFAQKCLGTEPPDHAAKWLRTEGKPGQAPATLFELWHAEDDIPMAA